MTVVIRNSHHIGCLAAFLQRATDRGLMITVASSDPAVATVAPFGGRKAVYTPDPLAVGIPTDGDPILIDISASITTNGMAARLRREGKRFPGSWALDATGKPTDDPSALFTDPPPGNPLGIKAPLAPILRAAMERDQVTAEVYHGPWTDVGTPERLAQLNA